MGKPHKHAEAIHAWADGKTIEWKGDMSGGKWCLIDIDGAPTWHERCEYRVKPERGFPVTSMKAFELARIFNAFKGDQELSWLAVANAAIKRHIIDTDRDKTDTGSKEQA